MKEPAQGGFGEARRTGFYAGAFELAQRTGEPIHAVAFRRSATSNVEVFRLDRPEDAASIFEMLLKEDVAASDMWPLTIAVGEISVAVTAQFKAGHLQDTRGVPTPLPAVSARSQSSSKNDPNT